MLDYHKNCTTILQTLTDTLYEKTNEASVKPRSDFTPKTLEDLGIDRASDYNLSAPDRTNIRPGSSNSTLPVGNASSTLISPAGSPASTPTRDAWGSGPSPSPKPSPAGTPTRSQQPSCQALYDFDAENPGELSFKEGDIIILKSKIDDNWYDGMVNGKSGYFPVTYVNVINPLH